MRPEKQVVFDIYSSVGWSKNPDGSYVDSGAEDKRIVSKEYISRCHERLGLLLDNSGGLFLDCASGPVQYPEYLSYSRNYRKRVCVDFSQAALREARANHGDHVLCVVADITRLPFRDDAFDAVLSMHTIYHVPSDEQEAAFAELFRTTRPGRKCVVVYSLGDSSLMNRILLIPHRIFNLVSGRSDRVRRLIGRLRRRIGPRSTRDPETANAPVAAGFYPHNWSWLQAHILNQEDRPSVAIWRSLSVPVLRSLIHRRAFGKQILKIAYRIENLFPAAIARIGQYPVIVRTK
jgi:SAM-dependent methyltransferase